MNKKISLGALWLIAILGIIFAIILSLLTKGIVTEFTGGIATGAFAFVVIISYFVGVTTGGPSAEKMP